MPSSKQYLEYVLEQLSPLSGISFRAMMGEYVIYYQGRIVGGIYDDRFLVKPTRSAKRLMPDARPELPYEGAKEMLPVEGLDDRDFLQTLLKEMLGDLPAPRRRR